VILEKGNEMSSEDGEINELDIKMAKLEKDTKSSYKAAIVLSLILVVVVLIVIALRSLKFI